MQRTIWLALGLVCIYACADGDPASPDPVFTSLSGPEQTPSKPAVTGLQVLDLNPNTTIHVFNFNAPSGTRTGLAVGASGNTATAVDAASPPAPSEVWQPKVLASGAVQLAVPGTNTCLTVVGGKFFVEVCGNANLQAWHVLPALYSDLGRLALAASGQCLSLDSNFLLTMSACASAPLWRLEMVQNGQAVEGVGYGEAVYNNSGTVVTGSGSLRPCSDTAVFPTDSNQVSWVRVTNGSSAALTVTSINTTASTAPLGTVSSGTSTVFQVPGGATLRLSRNGLCQTFVDTAVVVRVGASDVVKPEGGTWHACADANSLQSANSNRIAYIRVFNDGVSNVNVSWIDYTGVVNPYGGATQGQQFVATTYQTHPWMVSDPNGVCLGIMVVNADPSP